MSALPIFPGRHQPSIFGANELNFRVRDGNGWTLIAINTDSRPLYVPDPPAAVLSSGTEDIITHLFSNCKCFYEIFIIFLSNSRFCSKYRTFGMSVNRKSRQHIRYHKYYWQNQYTYKIPPDKTENKA